MSPRVIHRLVMYPEDNSIGRVDSAWVDYDTAVDYLTREYKAEQIDAHSNIWRARNGDVYEIISSYVMTEEDIEDMSE